MNLSAVIASIVALFATLFAYPAFATDCSKASSAIEKALCTKYLQDTDSHLNSVFADMRSYLPEDKGAALLADQKAWLKQRDASCTALPDNQLLLCLHKQTVARTEALLTQFTNEHPLKSFSDDFTLGGHKLQVLDHQIVENGKVIFEDSDFGIEISIEDGFHTKDVDAVALVVSDGGTLLCSFARSLAAFFPFDFDDEAHA